MRTNELSVRRRFGADPAPLRRRWNGNDPRNSELRIRTAESTPTAPVLGTSNLNFHEPRVDLALNHFVCRAIHNTFTGEVKHNMNV